MRDRELPITRLLGRQRSHRSIRDRTLPRPPRRTVIAAATAVGLAVIVGLLLLSSRGPSDQPPFVRAGGGAVPAPVRGAYFGAWTSKTTGHTLEQREAEIGRRYEIVHLYYGWDDVFPTGRERLWSRQGRILFFDWASRIFRTDRLVRWRRIVNGSDDRAIDAAARRIRALGSPVLMSFNEEPEAYVGRAGTVRDFASAYRHIRSRFIAAGATNVAWVWDVSGFRGYDWMYRQGLYPGDAAVDWIAWDPYNWFRCHAKPWRGFARTVSRFYGWLIANGYGNKPFMLAEYGSSEHPADPLAKGRWFEQELATLKSGFFPNLKALVYFDSDTGGACNWRIDTSRASLEGFRALASDRFLRP
jgi:hypothetical protein